MPSTQRISLSIAVFVGLFILLSLSIPSIIGNTLVSALSAGVFYIFSNKATHHKTRNSPQPSWFPPTTRHLTECFVCGQHNSFLVHACLLWVEPDGTSSSTANKPSPARILDNKELLVWKCSHMHTDRASRRQCAFQHLIAHQEGQCTCSSSPHKNRLLKRRLPPRATVYIIVNKKLDAAKIGIAGENTGRVKKHLHHGWSLYYESSPVARHQALQAEEYVLHYWRNIHDLPLGTQAENMPQNGYTETVPLSQVNLAETRLLLWQYLGNGTLTRE